MAVMASDFFSEVKVNRPPLELDNGKLTIIARL